MFCSLRGLLLSLVTQYNKPFVFMFSCFNALMKMVYTPNRYKSKAAINLPQMNLILSVLIGVLGIIYLFQINFTVSHGYRARDLSQTIDETKKRAKQLEVEALDLQSMQKIKEQATQLGMVSVGRATYVSARNPVVALK